MTKLRLAAGHTRAMSPYSSTTVTDQNSGDWRIGSFDATSLLSLFVWLFAFIPSVLIFAPLGSSGTPAQVLGIVLLIWWLGHTVRHAPSIPRQGPSIRIALGVYACSIVGSYIIAVTRPIEAVEINGSDHILISLAAWSGVLLFSMDALGTRARFDTLVRRAANAGGVISILGVVQFTTHRMWVDMIAIPGLKFNSDLEASSRSGFSRPAGTATHPIEFGVVLTMLLPLALHRALTSTDESPFRRWWPVAALAIACPLSISRTTIMCLSLSLPVVIAAWPRSRRRAAYGAIAAAAAVIYEFVPGMLGTLLGLFTGIKSDGSAHSRTDSYSIAFDYWLRWPILGRGYGTFLPDYHILDNMILGILISGGIVGLLTTTYFVITAVRTARSVWRASPRDSWPDSAARALTASIIAGVASFATFDALAFPMVPCLMFLAVGLTGSLARMSVEGDGIDIPPAHTSTVTHV